MRRVVFIYKYFVPFLLFHKKTADRAFFDGIVRAFEIIGIGEAQQLLEDTFCILYLACMRFPCLLFCIVLSAGCAGRSINTNRARNAIADMSQGALEKEDVDVVKVTSIGGSEAIAETRLKTAFRIEKVKGKWVVREVRLGHGQWEKASDLAAALEAVKTDETKRTLDRISEAIQKYRESTGKLPVFKDYIALSDQLSPAYLAPLIRLDSWKHPLAAEHTGADTIILQSAGPDGKLDTSDDIRLTISQ